MARKPAHETAARNAEILARRSEGAAALAEAFGLSKPQVYRILATTAPTDQPTPSRLAALQTPSEERGRFARTASRRTDTYARGIQGDTFKSLAKSGLKRYGNSVDDDYDRVFRRGLRARVALYREMGDDPVPHAILQAARQMIGRVRWYVEPASSKAGDKKAAEFVEQCMHDMSHSWTSVIDQACEMLQYGFAVAEEVYKPRKGPNGKIARSKYNDGLIGWRKFQFLAPDSLAPGNEWQFDEEDGGLQSVSQQPPPAGEIVTIPIDRLALFRTTESRGNPEGRSILRAMYKPWYFKANLEEIEAISSERMGAGFPVIYAGADVGKGESASSDFNLLKDIGRNIRTDEQMSVILPFAKMGGGAKEGDGVLIELLRPNGTAPDFGTIITRYEQRIAMVGLGQFMMLGMSKIGTQALAVEQGDMFVMALDGWLSKISDVLNRFAVERLVALNYFAGMTEVPLLKCETVGKVDLGAFATAVNTLAQAQLLTPGPELEAYIRKLADLPERIEAPEVAPTDSTEDAPTDSTDAESVDQTDENGDTPPTDNTDGNNPPDPKTPPDGGTEKASAELEADLATAPVLTRGIMVAFGLPDEVRAALAVPGGESEDHLHLTLAIVNVPDTGSLTEDMRGLVEVVRGFAQSYRSMGALVTGPAMFAPGPDGAPIVALVDVPTLPEFRADLVAAIEAAGYTIKRNHGYIPHITRFYAPEPTPVLPETPVLPFMLSELVVAEEDLWVTVPLAGAEDYGRVLADFEQLRERHARVSLDLFRAILPDVFARGFGHGRTKAERAVNDYEESLRDTYKAWAEETADTMAEADDDDQRLEILTAALAVLLAKLQSMGRRGLPDAAALALSDAESGYSPEMLREIADAVGSNDTYLANLTTTDIPAKMRDVLSDPDTQTAIAGGVGAAVLAGALMKYVGRVGSYSGAWWGLHNKVVGLDFDARQEVSAGTNPKESDDVKLFWSIEPGANHCATCIEFGNTVYDSYRELLIRTGGVTPGDGTQCGGNCRCKLGAATREQIAAYMSAWQSVEAFMASNQPRDPGAPLV